MATPMKSIGQFLFGGSDPAQPMMPTPQQSAPAPAPPLQSPTGAPGTYKNNSGPSFVSSAAPAPRPGQTGGKSLLGQ